MMMMIKAWPSMHDASIFINYCSHFLIFFLHPSAGFQIPYTGERRGSNDDGRDDRLDFVTHTNSSNFKVQSHNLPTTLFFFFFFFLILILFSLVLRKGPTISPPFHSLINAAIEFNEAFTTPSLLPHSISPMTPLVLVFNNLLISLFSSPCLPLSLSSSLCHTKIICTKTQPNPFPWESAKPLMNGIAHQKKN